MKILVLIGGRFNSIDEKWWINFSDKTGLHFDFAVSKWSNCELHLGEWIKSRIVWFDEEDPDEVGSVYKNLELNEIHIQDHAKPFNTLMMWHKWRRFIFFENFDSYHCIIKTRADIEIDAQFSDDIAKAIFRVIESPNLIAIPSGGDHRRSHAGSPKGVNDVFAIGTVAAMKTYLLIINFWQQYYKSVGYFHPETLLRFHLCDGNKIPLLRFPALIRLRGIDYNHYSERWYVDTLKVKSNFLARKRDRFKQKRNFF